jgi:tripartite-type tricarboxylate transporter receptor subunit TctC
VPAQTPREIVIRLNTALREALADEKVRAAYKRVGADPADPAPPEVFAARAKRDGERWAPLIRQLKLVAE